ncbi:MULTISPECIES: dGTP triphosphohydrolase [unclassified Achromobacter]|uniref:dGTP triphosphohydrolase n=1 Tax=unclassified Achromobacter TaxID=2626865 RepID=UPI000B51ACC5|nr:MULTISPECIES: dNTP triphosphohydrolase [unclassified Achromobacter]OWT74655.1 deoxyguanosinetriphosphate triphosphohydrolase [Achromobacter sp. HZ34]OWT79122.1 deoxyguanosinetriphosphate triphosphohydrolase [Achromobacter sp. HZ28]
MQWERLLTPQRLGKRAAPEEQDPRSEFTRDNDRIVFSSAFRRMQDKTQVFPLAKSDYVRTRLTHSLEVASVGRSLGMRAAERIRRVCPEAATVVRPDEVGMIVASACLAHDIGNPPFGHAGESAIQEWFSRAPEGREFLSCSGMSAAERADLEAFEGNAQGFRILTRLQYPQQRGGMHLTAAMLATFAKYPGASTAADADGAAIGRHKFSYMQSEADLFEEVAAMTGLLPRSQPAGSATPPAASSAPSPAPSPAPSQATSPAVPLAWHRHPLAFLVEAADDICYHVMDIEDGYKAGVVSYEQLLSLHQPWRDAHIDGRAEQMGTDAQKAEFYRAKTIGKLIDDVVDQFEASLPGMLDGSFDRELVLGIPRSAAFRHFKDVARERVYRHQAVLEIEACGFEVISGLLSAFLGAVEDNAARGEKGQSVRTRTLLHLMPGARGDFATLRPYERALCVTDFVSGMTDTYAVEFYQRIRGITLP